MFSKQKLGSYFLAAIFSLPQLVCAAPIKITSIQALSEPNAVQIALKLTSPSQPHIFTLEHPDRLVLDFNNTQLATKLINQFSTNSPIKDMRVGYPKPSILRLVIDLNKAAHYKTLTVLPSQRIMISLLASSVIQKNKIIKPKPLEVTQPETSRPLVVMIDPGHGGKDTGAIGDAKTKEKDVVLAIAKQLAQLINAQPHMRAVLTRNGDYYVTLHNRLVYARKNKADIFLSIHADSYFNNRASGASIYALSKHGATSIAARWLAMRDNYSELEGVTFKHLEDQSPMLRSVLIDLAQTTTVRDSMRLGVSLLDVLENVTSLHYTKVEQAPFMVLKSPDIPSILVETGFISNPAEEMRLRDKVYQHKIAVALLNGIRFYQKKYAVVGV
jgi:N-acetylmuramoyl-L-alanine amidase